MRKGFFAWFIGDLLLVSLAFSLCIWFKPGSTSVYFETYFNSFVLFLLIWIILSFPFNKYNPSDFSSLGAFLKRIFIANIFIFFVVTSIMYLFQSFNYSRFIVLGTIGVTTLAEALFGSLYSLVSQTRIRFENGSITETLQDKQSDLKTKVPIYHRRIVPKPDFKLRYEFLKSAIGDEAFNYILYYAALDSPNTLIISTTTRFNIDAQIQPYFECIINIKRVNDFRYINKYFESVNAKLPAGGLLIGHFETKNMRKKRILSKFPPGINYIYYSIDFVVKRVFPKFNLTKKLYFILTRGENRVISKAEMFGRLYSCGFEILDERLMEKGMYFIAIKVKEPLFPKNPSYGPLIALQRIGKEGKIIKVYKMRTMHPFAEYLQDYIYERVGLQEGGKFKDDFRITTIGKILRTFWLDELPMLINFFKGELKLFGVRPLSKQYFKLYTPELQRIRIKSKPGLIPPFYVDDPKTLEEIMASELKYLRAYEKHPLRTDWVYFWKAIFNIVFKKYRSK